MQVETSVDFMGQSNVRSPSLEQLSVVVKDNVFACFLEISQYTFLSNLVLERYNTTLCKVIEEDPVVSNILQGAFYKHYSIKAWTVFDKTNISFINILVNGDRLKRLTNTCLKYLLQVVTIKLNFLSLVPIVLKEC